MSPLVTRIRIKQIDTFAGLAVSCVIVIRRWWLTSRFTTAAWDNFAGGLCGGCWSLAQIARRHNAVRSLVASDVYMLVAVAIKVRKLVLYSSWQCSVH